MAVDGQKIEAWEEALAAIRGSSGRALTFTVQRDGRRFDVHLEPRPLKTQDVFGQEIEVWDVGLQEPLISTRIGELTPGDIAQKAGIKSGDLIVAINGEPVSDWEQMRKGIRGSPGKPLRLTVEREGQRVDILVTPRPSKQRTAKGEEEIGQIGIGPAPDSHYRRLNPVSALAAGVQKTWELSVLIVQGFVKLIQAKISPKTIGGPILIIQAAGEVVQRGTVQTLTFTALISINLAILNLLPIPVLDGGHLLFSLIEWLRGKPVSLRKREIAQQVGMVLIIGLMIFAFYNDIFRFLGRQ
jgi:regulator of sigma E protease